MEVGLVTMATMNRLALIVAMCVVRTDTASTVDVFLFVLGTATNSSCSCSEMILMCT